MLESELQNLLVFDDLSKNVLEVIEELSGIDIFSTKITIVVFNSCCN